MKIQRVLFVLLSVFSILSLPACSVIDALSPTETPTQTSTPTQTPTPTVTPTATDIPYYLDSIVWSGQLQVPLLIYHRFVGDDAEKSTSTKMRYADFKQQLQDLYDNGYSLISLQDWMNGTFILPAGRKPLIISMDDGIFSDQLFLNDDGTPYEYSGVGILWAFSQQHPDFGFSVSIFTNMGDHKTADKHGTDGYADWFFVSEGDAWMDKLGQTIAWGIENGVEFYNHLYTHPKLSLTDNAGIIFELKENDRVLRFYLDRVGRTDLIPQLGNMIALPYGEWPATQNGINILQQYKNTEGKFVQAIFEAYNVEYDEQQMTASIFSDGFNPYKMARIMANLSSVNWVIQQKDSIPTAASCKLGPLKEEQSADLQVIQGLIQNAVSEQSCPEGVYNVNGSVFVAKNGTVSLYYDQSVQALPQPTATP